MRKFQRWLLEYLFCDLQKWRCIRSLWEKIWWKVSFKPSLRILFPRKLRISWSWGCFLLSAVSAAPLLIQILARCDATDHTRHYWSKSVTLGRRGVLLAPSGVSAFLFYALAPRQGKGHTWKDPACLSHWGINSHPDCQIQRLHCLFPCLQKN